METKNDIQDRQSNQPKKIYRSKIDRIIAGACGGVAEYFEIDPVIVRIIWIFSVFFGGIGVLAYIACLVVIKENPDQSFADQKKDQNTALYWGIGLILLGLSFFSSSWNWRFFHFNPFHFEIFHPWFLDWDRFWPLVLIILGVVYLVYVLRQKKDGEQRTTDETRKIYRSRDERVIGGVCGGIAKNLNIDPVIVRIGWIVLSLMTKVFLGIIVYIVWMIVVHEEPFRRNTEPENAAVDSPNSSEKKSPKRVKKIPEKKEEEKEDQDEFNQK